MRGLGASIALNIRISLEERSSRNVIRLAK